MTVGMLWFDNDPKRPLDKKIQGAVEYYVIKYGAHPDMCFVHPNMLKLGVPDVTGITVRGNKTILPNHIWVGVSDE